MALNSPVQKIKERLTIDEVVSTYIKLERSGSTLKAPCPFHNEKTPSFFVSPARNSYYCFGCGASGDIFTFVEEFEGLDFKGALKLLADKAGVQLGTYNEAEETEKEKLYRIMEEATKFFENNLHSAPDVKEYLKKRGLEEKSIKDFRIGYVLNDWRTVHIHLTSLGFTEALIEKAGLIKKTDKGFYDRFRGRVMFPIGDSSGRIIAFSGRIFVDDGKSAKYLNSPDTPIFSKSSVLYGLDKAKEHIRKNNFSILVEGQMDLVLSHQVGYKNTVATSGTALSDSTVSKENAVSNLGLVRRITPNIVLAFDGDKAGMNASGRAGKIALSLGMDVKVANLPTGMDPADLISKQGTEAWKEAVKNSKHIIEFLLGKVIEGAHGDARKAGREIKEKILPYINSLDSSIEQMHFIKKVSNASGIPESALKDDLKKAELETKFEKPIIPVQAKPTNQIFRRDYIERKLLGVILWQKGMGERTIDVDNVIKKLAAILEVTEEEIIIKGEKNMQDLVFEAEVFYGLGVHLQEDIDELLANLEEESLKEKLARRMRELYAAEEKKDSTLSSQILKECQDINNKIQEISKGRTK